MDKTTRIRELNDEFRRTFAGGRVFMTAGLNALPQQVLAAVLHKVRTFEAFDRGNDPHGEHDFVSIEHDGVRYFSKIDYYDAHLRHGSEDPSDSAQTTRVLTIMLAEEY
jgi:hypothetical protein